MSFPEGRGGVRLLSRYARTRPAEFARSLARGTAAEVASVLGELPDDAALPVVVRLPREALAACPEPAFVSWIAAGSPHDGARALSLLSPGRRAALDRILSPAVRNSLERAGRFPAGSAGALADPDFVRVCRDWTVEEAVSALRRSPAAGRPILVVDRDDRTVGFLDAARALALGPRASVGDCALRVRSLAADASARRAAARPIWPDHGRLPVTDPAGRPVGILARSRVMAVAPRGPATGGRSVVADLAGLQVETVAELVRLVRTR